MQRHTLKERKTKGCHIHGEIKSQLLLTAYDAIKSFYSNPGGNQSSADENPVFFSFCTSSNPRGLNSIYISLHGGIIRQVYKVLAYIEVIYIYIHKKKKIRDWENPQSYTTQSCTSRPKVRCGVLQFV